MNKTYDVILLGTGLTECIMSGLLATRGASVLHIDRNDYYGGASASLHLQQLFDQLEEKGAKLPQELGDPRDYNVDICPKFIMACGDLVKILLHSKVTRYLDFRSVAASYVYSDKKIHKVPATLKEAATSSLLGAMQMVNFTKFIRWVDAYDFKDPKTWQDLDVTKVTTAEAYAHFNLQADAQALTGHAIALHMNDDYLKQPAIDTVKRAKLYAYSLSRYGRSPYIYPVWGLGGIAEGFTRLAALHGGVYMLNRPVDAILYNEDGTVKGIKSQGEEVYCKKLLGDPSYFLPNDEKERDAPKVKQVGRVARCICILNHPIPHSDDADSCQIVLPHHMIQGRKSDIYVFCVSHTHKVAPKGLFIAVVSGLVETDKPEDELKPGLDLLGEIKKKFFFTSNLYHPTSDGRKDNVFISHSFDASSHFDTACEDVVDLYHRMTGEHVDLTISADPEDVEKSHEVDESEEKQ